MITPSLDRISVRFALCALAEMGAKRCLHHEMGAQVLCCLKVGVQRRNDPHTQGKAVGKCVKYRYATSSPQIMCNLPNDAALVGCVGTVLM